MLTRERVQSGHTLRLTVTRDATGWAVREEKDSRVVRTTGYTDWHRVERAVVRFELDDAPLGEAVVEPV